ncbi:hypothetical protein IQ37_04065 [Chryseobacterium piperi]|uniref:Uncharacterized protein n=2 Tax=Chryseobacterium piperi TaxID=558152 RepID=A0A086BLM0_9FLAO|nr:hypothetical protein CJF12_02440 [Chryseobacterium piperi]KFF29834.1 hypothetical protein IQ37_04065 [Chryseobacterium piperi]
MDNITQNAYVKDLNNELNPYIGTYKANFEGNQITLYITKEEKKPTKNLNKNYYKDILNVKFIIKNSAGITLQDTKNNSSQINTIYSMNTNSIRNIVSLSYSGTNCGVGWGKINLKKINSTQLSWEYRPNSRVIDKARCPGNPDLTVYIPESQNLIFTKQ